MHEAENILRSFPDIELSYEKKIHNKVPFHNIVLTIPKGGKFFAWFRVYKKNNVCLLLELDQYKRKIKTITIQRCCFDSELCMKRGTIIYGTKFIYNSSPFFNMEDILFFQSVNVINRTPVNKIELMSKIIKSYMQQISYSYNEIIFGLPVMAKNKESLIKQLHTVPYPLYSIQYRDLTRRTPFYNECRFQRLNNEQIFVIRAALEDDIYDLYVNTKTNKLVKYSTAFIADVKTSVWMNSLFRNIKENANLDALEESDDEEEFENIWLDKYVNLEKEYKIKCVYIPKFRAWKPKEICENGIICNIDDIRKIEKKNN